MISRTSPCVNWRKCSRAHQPPVIDPKHAAKLSAILVATLAAILAAVALAHWREAIGGIAK